MKYLNIKFHTSKKTVGRINSGHVFFYKGRFWCVLNPLPEKGGKLVATMFDKSEQITKCLKSDTEVMLISGYTNKGKGRSKK